MSTDDARSTSGLLLSPVPWRGGAAGAASSGVVVLLVSGPLDEDQLATFLLLPLLVVAWIVVATLIVAAAGVRPALAVAMAGLLAGGFLALGIPHDAGSTGWNLAVLIAGTCGTALAEWLLAAPWWPKGIVCIGVLVIGVWVVDQISQDVNQTRISEAIAETPAPYTVEVDGWSIAGLDRFPDARTSLVELDVEDADGEHGTVEIKTFGRGEGAKQVCRATGDACRSLVGALWTSRTGNLIQVYRRVNDVVASMEFDRRVVPLDVATGAMATLRPLTDGEMDQLQS